MRRERRPHGRLAERVVVEDVSHRCSQVGKRQDVGPREVDRPYMHRVRAHGPSQPDVTGTVTNHPGRREIETERLRCGKRHARPGLSVGTCARERLHRPVRVIRAEQPEVDVRAPSRHLLDHVLVHLVNVLDAEIASRDAGLVRHHRHRQPGSIQRGDRLDRAVQELDSVYRADVPVVGDDRSVAIKQNAWSAHHSPPSV